MFWTEGIARPSSPGLVLSTLHRDTLRSHRPLADLGTRLQLGTTSRVKISTDFRSWTLGPVLPFWEAAGITNACPRDDHRIFKVVDGSTEYLIPASVLIAGLIRPIKHIHPFLFMPQGLQEMSLPLLDAAKPTVGFFLPLHRVIGTSRGCIDGVLASYSWMHCFPSAHLMWGSVFQHALNGKLAIELPQASLRANLHSVAFMGCRLVTHMVVTRVHADEEPYEFARGHTRDIVFHESAVIDWGAKQDVAMVLPNQSGSWALSDAEWSLVAPSVQKGKPGKHDQRHIIDLIVEKLGSGVPWRQLSFQGLNFPIVQATHRRLQKDGRLSAMLMQLCEARSSPSTGQNAPIKAAI